jgi:hypothetical protein
MNCVLKITALTLALGATFSVQASSYSTYTAVDVPVVGMPLSAFPFISMTTEFIGNGFSGFLRSAFANNTVFYQIVNDPGSTVSISGLSYSGNEAQFDCCMSYGHAPVVSQTNLAFDIFTAGQSKASLVETYEHISGGWQVPTHYEQTIDFMGGPVWTGGMSLPETVYGEVLPGVTPGTTSYTEMVQGWYTLDKVSINGVAVDAFVSVVPEPETYALMLAGLGLISSIFRRRKAKPGSTAMPTAFEGALA